MGMKLLWTGLTLIVAIPLLPVIGGWLPWALIGALAMLVGLVLYLLDK